MENVVVEELEDHGEDGHGADDPDEAGGVVAKVAILYNGGREADNEGDDELSVVEDVKCNLADEGGDVKTGRVGVCLKSFSGLPVPILIVDPNKGAHLKMM